MKTTKTLGCPTTTYQKLEPEDFGLTNFTATASDGGIEGLFAHTLNKLNQQQLSVALAAADVTTKLDWVKQDVAMGVQAMASTASLTAAAAKLAEAAAKVQTYADLASQLADVTLGH